MNTHYVAYWGFILDPEKPKYIRAVLPNGTSIIMGYAKFTAETLTKARRKATHICKQDELIHPWLIKNKPRWNENCPHPFLDKNTEYTTFRHFTKIPQYEKPLGLPSDVESAFLVLQCKGHTS